MAAVAASARSCYIAAPAGSPLDGLVRALQERGIRIVAPEFVEPSSNWPAETAKQLAAVDFVVGVLTRERRSDWALFELGSPVSSRGCV